MASAAALTPTGLGLEAMVAVTKALADPTRVRIMSVLRGHELSVNELCRVLDQSQPRVSRHLKMLTDAGLLRRNADGVHAFFRLSDTEVADAAGRLIGHLHDGDVQLDVDHRRLAQVRREREARANEYFGEIAAQWDQVRARHVDDRLVEAAMVDALPKRRQRTLLDLGTGTGRVLELMADRVDTGIGIDLSNQMLHLARTRIEAGGHHNLRVQRASIMSLEHIAADVDVAVIHHVLHFLDEPAVAIEAAARALAPHGALLVVDFAPHGVEQLRREHAHTRLGISEAEMQRWCEHAGLDIDLVHHLRPSGDAADDALVVSLWRARRVAARTTLEVAS